MGVSTRGMPTDAHGAGAGQATEPQGGAARRRKYGDIERKEPAARTVKAACVRRGRLGRAECAVCLIATAAVCLQAVRKFGLETVGGDLVSIALLAAVCALVGGLVVRSPLYRTGADPGVLVGCTAVPALVTALMLRFPAGSSESDLEPVRFLLRIAVSSSGLAVVEGVLGDGRWSGAGTRWREELRPMGALILLGAMAALRHPVVAWPVPLATLALATASMRALLRCTPGSFTLGEATIISSGTTLLLVDSGAMFLSKAGRWPGIPLARRLAPVDIAVQSLLAGTMIIVAIMWRFMSPAQSSADRCASKDQHKERCNSGMQGAACPAAGEMATIAETSPEEEARAERLHDPHARNTAHNFKPTCAPMFDRNSAFVIWLAGSVGFLCIPPASFLLEQHFLLWVAAHVTETRERLALLVYWLVVLGAVVEYMAVIFPQQRSSLPKTVVRKSYHILALLLFGPGQVLQPEMLRLAYAAAFALLCTLELVRGARLRRLSDLLQRFVDEHKDDRDGGVVVLTHIYLLLGCAIPSFLCPHSVAEREGHFGILLPLSGVLIVGVGDTAASIYGKLCGRTRWNSGRNWPPDAGGKGASGSKTVEGTIAGAVCTVAAAGLCVCLGGGVKGPLAAEPSGWAWGACAVVAATAAAMSLEAFTEQIDNLVLPLWYFTMLSAATRA